MAELPAAVLKGLEEFNRRAFFEAHETWEDVWAEESGDRRRFYQGLIQVAIACCHVQRGNADGALNLYAGGCLKLAPFAPAREGLDVAGFLASAEACAAQVRELGSEGISEFDPTLFPVLRRLPCP